MSRARVLAVLLLGSLGAGAYYVTHRPPASLVLTGIVTTDDVVVSAQIPGQIAELRVKEGDRVTRGQVIAAIVSDELRADRAYYAQTAQGATSLVQQHEAALRYAQQQSGNQVRQAEATLAAAESTRAAAEADLENSRLTFDRNQKLMKAGIVSAGQFDQSRTALDAETARVTSLVKQADAARAAVATARSEAEQVAVRRSELQSSVHGSAAAAAQRDKADVRLGYAEVRAPFDGLVDVRAAREGEIVAAGQPIVTLVNPDDFWVRVDVEETYIDRVRPGDHLSIRLPSGDRIDGTVFFRGADAGYATQRDVSRTKRDIKTFEIRLRVDNRDRRLAPGMTAYVDLPLASR